MCRRLSILIGLLSVILFIHDAGAQWVKLDGPNTAPILCFATDGSTLFAGAYTGGVFLTTNSGVSWSDAGLQANQIYSLALRGNNLFAGTYNDGVFLTTNNGTDWTAVNNGLAGVTHTYVGAFARSE